MSEHVESEVTEVERIKEASGGLRGSLPEELATRAPDFTEPARQVLKFHGVYQQEDRDSRTPRRRAGLEPEYSMMVRSKIPGGVLDWDQYLVHDDLATRLGNGTLRVTTRQGIQLHGVVKGDLKETVRTLNEALVTTLGACGDVQRNVLGCPAPVDGGAREEALRVVREISSRTLPSTGAYHEIWVDGEQVVEARPDPLYGTRYLPRKFKTALAFSDDNCTDVLSNDVGLLAETRAGALEGFEVVVGGGLGMTHRKPETFPRLADRLTWIEPGDAVDVVRAVIAVQRDHGDRLDRRHARMKYLVRDRGLTWFRARVEEHLGWSLPRPRGLEIRDVEDHLGWHRQAGGGWFYGLHVENGRIRDSGELGLRSALRDLVERFRPGVRLTPQQNLLLTDIDDGHRAEFADRLRYHGLNQERDLTTVRRWALACPALPTCGLALAESERALPGVLDRLESTLRELGLEEERFTVRMTGCPNGCARPYTAEIGFVGRGRDKYTVFLGGSVKGDRLGVEVADLVERDALVATVRPVLARFRSDRRSGETLADFLDRIGPQSLREWVRPSEAQ